MKRFRPSIVWFGFLASACTYSPEEEYFKVVEQTDPVVSISLDKFNEDDTIFLFSPTDFTYQVAIDKGSIREANVLFDGRQLVHNVGSQSASGKFSLRSTEIKTGVFELKIQFVSTTASGSLADQEKLENIEVWKKWVVKIEADVPDRPTLRFSEENGFLKISWDPFLKPNFVSYSFSKSSIGYGQVKYFTITNPLQTSMIDSAYVGGHNASYFVGIQTILGGSSSGEVRHYSHQSFDVTYTGSDSVAVLKWRKSKYEKAFKEYVIKEDNDIVRTITAVNDTVLSLKLKQVILNKRSYVSLEVIPTYRGYDRFQSTKEVLNTVTTKKLAGSPVLFYNEGINSIVGVKVYNALLCHYDANLQPVDSTNLTADIPNFIPSVGIYGYRFGTGQLKQINLNTLEQKNVAVRDSANFYSGPSSNTGASNSLIAYGYTKKFTNGSRYYQQIYDMSSNKLIYTTSIFSQFPSYTPTKLWLSSDGRFVYFSTGQVYKIENGILSLIGSLPVGATFIKFRPDNNDEILVSFTGRIEIYNSNDVTLKRTITIPGLNNLFQDYDPITKYMMFERYSGGQEIYFVHIDSNDTRMIKAVYSSNGNYKLLGGFLFYGQVSYLKVL